MTLDDLHTGSSVPTSWLASPADLAWTSRMSTRIRLHRLPREGGDPTRAIV